MTLHTMTLLDSTFRKHLHDNISRFPNKKELSHHTLLCSETAPSFLRFIGVLERHRSVEYKMVPTIILAVMDKIAKAHELVTD